MMVFFKRPVKEIPVPQIELQFHDKSGQLSLSTSFGYLQTRETARSVASSLMELKK